MFGKIGQTTLKVWENLDNGESGLKTRKESGLIYEQPLIDIFNLTLVAAIKISNISFNKNNTHAMGNSGQVKFFNENRKTADLSAK